jgi:Ca-activated chloride channel family protein
MTLHITTDRRLVRAGVQSTRYLRVRFTAPEAPRHGERLPLDVALVIDRSGSMAGGKLELAKMAARRAVELLGPRDHVALVAYDTEVELLAAGAPLDPSHQHRLLSAIDHLHTGSSTNLSGGWLLGCEEVGRAGRDGTVARTLLLSDGLANHGITDVNVLKTHAGELRARGVATSTFGIGADFDERLMEGMARSGGGNFYYLQHPEQIPEFLMSELGEALEVVARGAVLTVEVEPGIMIASLDDRRTTRNGSTVEIALDDLVSRQQMELVLRVTFPRGAVGATSGLSVQLTDRDGVLQVRPVWVDWEYADHDANDAQRRDEEVDLAVAQRYAARAREEAAELNRAGDLERARGVLLATARRIKEYAGHNPQMRELVRELERTAVRHRDRLERSALKGERFEAYNIREAKDLLGRKLRST